MSTQDRLPRRPPRPKTAATAKAIFVATFAAAAQCGSAANAATDDDVDALLRHLQIEDWVGATVPLPDSLCAQQALLMQGNWPRKDNPGERQLERLHQTLEACSRGNGKPEQASDDRGLLTIAREDFRARLQRLGHLQQLLQACERDLKSATDQCRRAVLGRALTDRELVQLERRAKGQ